MAQYTLIDPVTGEQSTLGEIELTRNIRLNCILLRDQKHLGIITHRDLVSFSRWCAGEMLAKVKGTPAPETQYVLTMVDQWLEDQQSVTPEELEAAAEAAWAAAGAAWAAADRAVAGAAAWAAAWAAAGTAEAARAAEAAWAAAGAAWAAADRAVAGAAADAAAWAAADAEAARAARAASYEAQAQWWVEHFQSEK